MKEFFETAAEQNHPLRVLRQFLAKERAREEAKKYDEMRFVGYVLDIGYDTMTIITSDPFKIAVGGVPRNSLLVVVPESLDGLPLHFTLIRVLESAPTPLSQEDQKTYFELHKRSMPELDVFTQANLQWGALKAGILGMFYKDPEEPNAVEFSGDLNNFVSAHKYRVYAPDDPLLDLIVNACVPAKNRFVIGRLRMTECRLPLPGRALPDVTIQISTDDLVGMRTAMFGKTRLGKSNVVKLIAESVIARPGDGRTVGQLIFDINGEYSNDNPQDDSKSLRSAHASVCDVYALTAKDATPSKPLKLNFYERPESGLPILASLLRQDGKASGYIQSFASVELPSIAEVASMPPGSQQGRALRKLQIYWAALSKAGYPVNEAQLRALAPTGSPANRLSPGFAQGLRDAAYGAGSVPQPPNTLDALQRELDAVATFRRSSPNSQLLTTGSGNALFDADETALLEFASPQPGRSGPSFLQPYRIYHDKSAGDFVNEIIGLLDAGRTVLLDLGNANPPVLEYFSSELSRQVFVHQVDKFSNNNLGTHFVQLYFEEAHNLFPRDEGRETRGSIYSRFAKEGAKYHIGMVYSTQSPTTISRDLLAQTENFFVAHLSSEDDVNALAKVNTAYASLGHDILVAKKPGYMRMLTRSHRFVVSVQARKFEAAAADKGGLDAVPAE